MMISMPALTGALGLEPGLREPLAFVSALEEGLSVLALDHLAEVIAPNDETFKYLIVPRPTLMRRRKGPSRRLSTEESGRLTRVAKIWAFAFQVWGSEAEARDFLGRPHPLLDGRKPIDLALASDFGGDIVENVLGGLHYGIAA